MKTDLLSDSSTHLAVLRHLQPKEYHVSHLAQRCVGHEFRGNVVYGVDPRDSSVLKEPYAAYAGRMTAKDIHPQKVIPLTMPQFEQEADNNDEAYDNSEETTSQDSSMDNGTSVGPGKETTPQTQTYVNRTSVDGVLGVGN